MEPFRPVVDTAPWLVSAMNAGRTCRSIEIRKKQILEGLLARFDARDESRTLFDWMGRVASSLAAAIEAEEASGAKLDIPEL